MGYPIKQNQTVQSLLFLMVDSADHLTGKTGLTPTVEIRKPGGAFAAPAGAVSEVGHGWYEVAGNATDAETLGPLLLHAEASGADPCDERYDVVSFDPQDAVRLGLSALPNAAADAAGGLPISDAGALDLDTFLSRLDAAVSSRLASASYTAPDNAGITAILEDTGTTLPAQIGALNNLSQAQAQTAAAAALTAYDPPTSAELEARTLASAAYATTEGQSSLSTALSTLSDKFAGITSLAWWLRLLGRKDAADATAKSEYNSGGGTYDEATDSQQGQTDTGGAGLTAEAVRQAVWVDAPSRTLTQSAAQVVSAVTGDAISVLRGDHLEIALTGIGSLVGRTKLWFTVKGDPARDADSAAVLQIEETAGLGRLNGATYGTGSDGVIVVTDEADGDLTITLKAAAARQLPIRTGMSYDLQILVDGEPVTRISGTFNVTADVTQAVS